MPTNSAPYCQRAWKVLRIAHSTRAQNPLRPRSDRHRDGHRGLFVLEGHEHGLNIVGRRQRVRIGEDDISVARGVPSLHAIVELGIGAHIVVADEQARGNMRVLGDRLLHMRNDRIMRRLHAEDHLVIRIVEREARVQRLFAEGFDPAQGPHERHGRSVGGRRKAALARPAFASRDAHREKIETEKKQAPGGAEIGDHRHCGVSFLFPSFHEAHRKGANRAQSAGEAPRGLVRRRRTGKFGSKRRPGRGSVNIPPDICSASWQKGLSSKARIRLELSGTSRRSLLMNAPIVRFAPSPTGRIHIGNARVALFNALFAVTQHGRFVLRFDDTDFARSTAGFAREIEIDLAWLGLEPDLVVRQSERGALYDSAAAQLKEQGRLYPCYETAEELEKRRKLQQARGLPPCTIALRSSFPKRSARASRLKDAARIGASGSSTRAFPGRTSFAATRISTARRFPIRC